MSEGTSIGQVSAFFDALSSYYKQTADYYAGVSSTAPLFMEVLPDIEYSQVVTESNKLASNNPSMVAGSLNESAYSMFAVIREASLRSKTRMDFWASAEADAATDSTFYKEQGILMKSYIRAASPAQG